MTKDEIMNYLELINGNSSIKQFFDLVQSIIKKWNHTVDFEQPHRYIDTEFSLPKESQISIDDQLRVIYNFAALSDISHHKQY